MKKLNFYKFIKKFGSYDGSSNKFSIVKPIDLILVVKADMPRELIIKYKDNFYLVKGNHSVGILLDEHYIVFENFKKEIDEIYLLTETDLFYYKLKSG
jgi:hypothetical protein